MSRIESVKTKARELGLDGLLITSEANRHYLSGFSGSNGWLLVGPHHQVLVTDGRYWSQVERQAPDWELVRFTSQEHKSLARALKVHLPNFGGRVGFEKHHVTVAEFEQMKEQLEGWQLEPVEKVVEQLRAIKQSQEIEALKAASQVACQAFRKALESFDEGVRERDFCAELEYQMQKFGARKPSFDSIVASGPNGAFPHAGVSDRKIAKGELVTVDFGAYLEGYASDATRTIWIGQPDDLSQRVFRVVKEAQSKALGAVRSGIKASELDGVARRHIEEAGFGEAFKHSLGHGIGMAVHEMPTLRSTVDTVLKEGMVITIEPGVYLEGQTGCRIEDTVVVTPEGFEYVTELPYQELGQHHPLEAF